MAYYDISLSWYNSDGTQEYIQDVDITKDPQEKIPIVETTEQENNQNENIPFFNTAEGNEIKNLDSTVDEEDDEDEDEGDKDDEKKDEEDEDDD